jgi:hypothetical protein
MTNTYMALIAALAAVPFVLLGIAGCGGGGDETAEASLTKDQYRSKANLICSKAATEQLKIAEKYLSAHPGAEEADMVLPAVIPPLEQALRELKELPVPNGFEVQMENFFEAFERALRDGNEEPLSLLPEQGNPFDEANALGKKYELGDCGISP